MMSRSLVYRLVLLLTFSTTALAARAGEFEQKVDLTPLKTLTIQHQQTLKTLDSYARQTVTTITGSSTLHGQPSLFTVLDMTFNPDAYVAANVIKMKNVPLRKDMQLHPAIPQAEKDRILKEGTISLAFLQMPETQKLF